MKRFFGSRTGRLAITYFAIIMVLTVLFSAVIFQTASRQFDRPLPPREFSRFEPQNDQDIQTLLSARAQEARASLLTNIAILNVIVGIGAAAFSYALARRTMQPIEAAMNEQTRFIGDASHELRTPLTALKSLNEVALRRKSIHEKDARQLASDNVNEIEKLQTLAESLLNLIQVNNDVDNSSDVSLQNTVSDAAASIVAQAQEKRISFDNQVGDIIVHTNVAALAQILRCLLDNAVKYSNSGTTIRAQSEIQKDVVIVYIIDEGVGIDSKHIRDIFKRFYRVDEARNTQEGRRGHGLGLAIAHEMSEKYDMNLRVSSKLGEGSTFSLTLPKR